jgi:hypothetical protein
MDGISPLLAKLSHLTPLSDEDGRILDALCLNEERFAANIDIVHEGDVPRSAFVLTHGMAFRYRLMPDDKRQILTFMVADELAAVETARLDHLAAICCSRAEDAAATGSPAGAWYTVTRGVLSANAMPFSLRAASIRR